MKFKNAKAKFNVRLVVIIWYVLLQSNEDMKILVKFRNDLPISLPVQLYNMSPHVCRAGFVLVIQEKDLVLLKVVKQRLRLALRRDKEAAAKLDKYRVTTRVQLIKMYFFW